MIRASTRTWFWILLPARRLPRFPPARRVTFLSPSASIAGVALPRYFRPATAGEAGGTTLRSLPLLFAAALVVTVASATFAAADDTMTYACHSYEIYHGTSGEGVGVSTDDGAVALAAQGQYVVYDGPLYGGYLYSLGLGTEQNGVEGYQRGDEVCDTTGGEVEADCFISCTF